MTDQPKNNRTFKILTWAMGIVLILFGTVFTLITQTNGRVDKVDDKTNINAAAVSSFKTDFETIKGDLKEVKETLRWLENYQKKSGAKSINGLLESLTKSPFQ